MEIAVQDGLIKKLSERAERLKDALTKMLKMVKYPRLVEMASKLLSTNNDESPVHGKAQLV